jgi:hypothetical protein
MIEKAEDSAEERFEKLEKGLLNNNRYELS